MSEPGKLLKSPKVDRYFSRPHFKEEKQKQKREWKRRQKEKKVRQKREERRKARTRGKKAEDHVEDVKHNTTSVQVDLADESAGRELPHKYGVNKSGQNSSKADKAREREKEGRQRGVQGLELSRGRQMINLSLKRKRPEISTKLDDQPRVFSKSSRVDKSTRRATITTPHQKKNPLPALREICPSLLNKTSDEPIGSGTFGAVFLAEYRGIKTAVKEMKKRNDSPEETERCRREVLHEAQILQSLGDHPNLPLLFGACTTIEPFCLVLQFHGIGGKSTTLHEAVKKRLLKRNSTARIFYEIVETLKYMHDQGFLHNDLKSNNVLIQQRSGELHPVLIDFGKSRAIAEAKGYRRGDLDYLAPEVKAGEKESTRSDIFSFGKMLGTAVEGRSFLPKFSELIASTTAVDASDRPLASEVSSELARKFSDE